ncbi:MAG: type 1 glutamine amidotransferase domain-containing protein [Vulcanimicrobiaceae bacterium]
MTKILMVVTSHSELPNGHKTGLWLEEYAVPYNEFISVNFDVVTASPKGGAAPIDPRSFDSEEASSKYARALEELKHTTALDAIDAASFDAIFFPGGHGPMFDLARDARVKAMVRYYVDNGKPVTAVCHGPAALVGATTAQGKPVVAGKRVTAFTNEEEREVQLDKVVPFLLEDKLREEGAKFEKAPNWADHVVTDGMLITGQNPQSSASAARATISALRTPIKT